MRRPLPQRVYGTHLPTAFYSSTPSLRTYRGVARVPDGCRVDDGRQVDVRTLYRVRDGLRQLGTVASR